MPETRECQNFDGQWFEYRYLDNQRRDSLHINNGDIDNQCLNSCKTQQLRFKLSKF